MALFIIRTVASVLTRWQLACQNAQNYRLAIVSGKDDHLITTLKLGVTVSNVELSPPTYRDNQALIGKVDLADRLAKSRRPRRNVDVYKAHPIQFAQAKGLNPVLMVGSSCNRVVIGTDNINSPHHTNQPFLILPLNDWQSA